MGPGGKSAHFAQLAPVSGFQGTKTSGVIWRGAAFNLITAVSLVAEESLRPPGRTGGSPLPLIWPNHRTSKASQRGPRRRRSVSLAVSGGSKKKPWLVETLAQKRGQTVATSPESGDGPFRGRVHRQRFNYACMETELYSLPVSTRAAGARW